jgi:aldehyde:ferredoxin oxidoreductase
MGICAFGTYGISPGLMAETLSAATGLNYTEGDLTKVEMIGVNLRRIFSIRHGLLPSDDTLPHRYTDDPPPDGGAKGSRVPIKTMVRDYYNVMGWDPKTAKPYRRTLVALGLEKEADDLWGKQP